MRKESSFHGLLNHSSPEEELHRNKWQRGLISICGGFIRYHLASLNDSSQNSLSGMFLGRAAPRELWKIWLVEVKQQPSCSSSRCCWSADSPHWCEVVATPTNASPFFGFSFRFSNSWARFRCLVPWWRAPALHTPKVRGNKNWHRFQSVFPRL